MGKREVPAEPTLSKRMKRLDAFAEELQELAVKQARRMINLSLHTKALLSTLPVALLATDSKGLVVTVNRSAREILGIEEKEILGKPLSDLFESGSGIGERIARAMAHVRPCHMSSRSLRLSSGREMVGNLYFQPLVDEEEAVSGLLLTVEDTTYLHFLHDAFKRYVPPSVSEMIARDPKALELGGEEKVLSVLFCDLEGFTAYSESLPPRRMVSILSDYFTEMTEQVFAFQGTLKEYVGDELMAIFGAPVEQPDHARRACGAALAMQERLASLRSEWSGKGRPQLRARIGINSGNMLVGNLGSPYRFSYGVLGDQVNLASRLEGLCGVYGVDILCGEDTAGAVANAFQIREIDRVRVKGRKATVRIHEVVCKSGALLPEKRRAAHAVYAEGLSAYYRRQWRNAGEHFEKALSLWPGDGPSRVMADRCSTYLKSPPGEDWEGVYEHRRKG
jgi:PAS domain S-box-containing protein